SGLKCEGVNFFLADGEAAGQEVFHVHLHVLPRFAGDGFGLRFGPHYANKPKRRELNEIADRKKKAPQSKKKNTSRILRYNDAGFVCDIHLRRILRFGIGADGRRSSRTTERTRNTRK